MRWILAIGLWLAAATPAMAQTTRAADLQPSVNWSGYVAENAYYSGVSALVQAPRPYAFQRLGFVASWVGIGGSSSPDLIQAGVEEVNQGPLVAYRAWIETLPRVSRDVVMDIQPGAWVLLDVHEVANDLWQITIVNGPNVFQTQISYPSSHTSAEWVVEEPALANGRLVPLAGVTGASFAKMTATANGKSASPTQLFPRAVAIVSPVGSVRAAPTQLGPDGASFTVTTQ